MPANAHAPTWASTPRATPPTGKEAPQLGVDVGDAVLLGVANRLKQIAHSRGYVARVGNDEFAVALHPVSDADAVARTALELQAALAAPMQCLSHELNAAVDVGISLCQRETRDVDALLSHADLALSRAKSDGLGNVQFFTSQMNDDVRRRLDILLSLRHALESDELTIHYQPIIEIKTRRILGLEVLVRWQHPRLGLVPPADSHLPVWCLGNSIAGRLRLVSLTLEAGQLDAYPQSRPKIAT